MESNFTLEYEVIVHEEDGSFWAEVTELPGCFAAGDTREELDESIADAISSYLSSESSRVDVTRISSTPTSQTTREQYTAVPC